MINSTSLLEIIPPTIQYDETEKAVILYCTPQLWNYLQDLKNTGLNDLSIIQLAKIYKELKSLAIQSEKDKENEKEK